MKTKQIPAIVMLIAGFITCIVAIFHNFDALRLTKTLLIVLLIFYILGGVLKLILDKNFNEMKDKKEEPEEIIEENNESKKENINSTGDNEK